MIRCVKEDARRKKDDLVDQLSVVHGFFFQRESVKHRCRTLGITNISDSLVRISILDEIQIGRYVVLAHVCERVVEELSCVTDRIKSVVTLTVSSASIITQINCIARLNQK